LNWTIFGSTSSIRSLLRWASVPGLIERHQTRVTADICGQYGSCGSATQGWMAGFRVVKTGVLTVSRAVGNRADFLRRGPNGARQCSTVRQVGGLLECAERCGTGTCRTTAHPCLNHSASGGLGQGTYRTTAKRRRVWRLGACGCHSREQRRNWTGFHGESVCGSQCHYNLDEERSGGA
jgi:hypothetical protein